MSDFDREELISLANVSHNLGLHEDSINYWKQVIKMSTPLNYDERGSVYSNYMCIRKNLYKCPDSLKCMSVENHLRLEIKHKLKSKYDKICDECIELFESYWIKRDENSEAVVDYQNYKASSYLSKTFFASIVDYEGEEEDGDESYDEEEEEEEGEDVDDVDNNVKIAKELFEEAFELAKENLSPAHASLLSVASNLSELHCYMDSPDDLSIAKEAYENGISHLHELDGKLKSDSEIQLENLKNQIERFSTEEN